MSHDQFLILNPLKLFMERLKLETSNFVHWLTNSPSNGRDCGHVTILGNNR